MIHEKLRRQLLSLCDALGPEDGTPAHIFCRPERERRSDVRKTRQLCRAAHRAVDLALSAAESAVLNTCRVERVEPAADASHLRVEVYSPTPAEAAEALAAAHGWLRSEVAASVRRKRVPHLCFVVVGDEGGGQ